MGLADILEHGTQARGEQDQIPHLETSVEKAAAAEAAQKAAKEALSRAAKEAEQKAAKDKPVPVWEQKKTTTVVSDEETYDDFKEFLGEDDF